MEESNYNTEDFIEHFKKNIYRISTSMDMVIFSPNVK